MKPAELVERALRNNSKSRNTILDPFGGSGTTVIACEKTGPLARVIELDPKYCEVIVRRWQAFTGGVARHEESGRAFDDVAAGARTKDAIQRTGRRGWGNTYLPIRSLIGARLGYGIDDNDIYRRFVGRELQSELLLKRNENGWLIV